MSLKKRFKNKFCNAKIVKGKLTDKRFKRLKRFVRKEGNAARCVGSVFFKKRGVAFVPLAVDW